MSNKSLEMERIIGVPLNEVSHATSLVLPEYVLNHAANAVEGTLIDYHERGAEYGFKNGVLAVRNLKFGTDYNLEKNKASVKGTGILRSLKAEFFRDPLLIDFHTHPNLSKDYFESRGMKQKKTTVGFIGLEEYSQVLRESARFFSGSDLARIELNQWIMRSMLLGTALGYTWIINPNPKIVVVGSRRHADKYGKELLELQRDEVKKVTADSDYKLDPNAIIKQGKEILTRYCESTGFVAFANNNYKDSSLMRIA